MIPRSLPVLLAALATPSLALAQDRPPEECGMAEGAAQYGPVQVGAAVTLQRHRFVGVDDNWDPQMSRWVGRAARVVRLAGVDSAGCPGVRVDVDGGQWFWRARDLGIGTGRQPRPAARATTSGGSSGGGTTPQECGPGPERYGPVVVGARVVLGRHRMVNGDDNWAEEMQQYVGQTARVLEQAGVDSASCPGVRVDIDGQQYFWRIRDLRMAGAGGVDPGTAFVQSTGVSTDHGRPATVVAWGGGAGTGAGLFGGGGAQTPQECAMTDATAQWGPIQVGSTVVLGRHRPVNGDENWGEDMTPLVGQQARVMRLVGVDDQGCPVVNVDADGGSHYWRIRDMTLP
jgi:hypothetical protein